MKRDKFVIEPWERTLADEKLVLVLWRVKFMLPILLGAIETCPEDLLEYEYLNPDCVESVLWWLEPDSGLSAFPLLTYWDKFCEFSVDFLLSGLDWSIDPCLDETACDTLIFFVLLWETLSLSREVRLGLLFLLSLSFVVSLLKFWNKPELDPLPDPSEDFELDPFNISTEIGYSWYRLL